MPSRLAIVAIAVIWAAILIPRMAAVYERSAAGRTTRRFQRAMAALGGGRRALAMTAAQHLGLFDSFSTQPFPAPPKANGVEHHSHTPG